MQLELRDAYLWNRFHAVGNRYPRPAGPNPAIEALAAARADVAAGKARYPRSARYSAAGAPFPGYGTRAMRWCESPADLGLRFVGYADKLARIDHTGWFTDEFQDSTVRGVVYQLPARNGRPVYVSGYDNADNGAADNGGPAAIDFGTLWTGTESDSDYYESNRHNGDGAKSAAYHADKLAERMAEQERAYQAASSAGMRWADIGETIANTRRDLLALLAERREAKAAGALYPSICATLAASVNRMLDSIREARAERMALASGEGLGRESVHSFYTGDADLRAAFNESAGEEVLS